MQNAFPLFNIIKRENLGLALCWRKLQTACVSFVPFSLGVRMLGNFISSFNTVWADVGGIESQCT